MSRMAHQSATVKIQKRIAMLVTIFKRCLMIKRRSFQLTSQLYFNGAKPTILKKINGNDRKMTKNLIHFGKHNLSSGTSHRVGSILLTKIFTQLKRINGNGTVKCYIMACSSYFRMKLVPSTTMSLL